MKLERMPSDAVLTRSLRRISSAVISSNGEDVFKLYLLRGTFWQPGKSDFYDLHGISYYVPAGIDCLGVGDFWDTKNEMTIVRLACVLRGLGRFTHFAKILGAGKMRARLS